MTNPLLRRLRIWFRAKVVLVLPPRTVRGLRNPPPSPSRPKESRRPNSSAQTPLCGARGPSGRERGYHKPSTCNNRTNTAWKSAHNEQHARLAYVLVALESDGISGEQHVITSKEQHGWCVSSGKRFTSHALWRDAPGKSRKSALELCQWRICPGQLLPKTLAPTLLFGRSGFVLCLPWVSRKLVFFAAICFV